MPAVDHLHQAEVWRPKSGEPVRIADMDDVWRFHTLRFMERHAPAWAQRYDMQASIRWGGEFEDSQAVFRPASLSPVAWVQELPLYRAVASGLPTGGQELGMLRERARHSSTCPARRSLEADCTCTPAATAPEPPAGWGIPVPEGWARGFLGIDREEQVAKPEPVRADASPDPDIDSSTGRPWFVDETGFNHRQPHAMNEYCRADSCSYCCNYHCDGFCEDLRNEQEGTS